MRILQKIMITILPADWAQSMEAESRTWMARCTCGHERSIWELGGIRWKATGNPRNLVHCPSCGRITWHKIYRRIPGN